MLAALDAAERGGEVERAVELKPAVPGTSYFYHAESDEAFQLVPPRSPADPGYFSKVFRSKKNGTWPGETARVVHS